MSLSEFAKGGSTQPSTLGSTPSGGSSLAAFAGRSDPSTGLNVASSSALQAVYGKDTTTLPRNVDEARKMQEDNPTLWGKISKNLLKPIGLVATASEETGRVIGDVIAGDTQAAGQDLMAIPGKLGGILTGTRTRTFTDVFKENWQGAGLNLDETNPDGSFNFTKSFINSLVPSLLGAITDLTADPLNYVGGGLTKTGKLAEKASALTKAGETIAADSKLANDIKMLGLTADDLVLAPTKAEQALKGQRAVLTFLANTRWEKTVYGGAPLYELGAKLSTGFQMSKAGQYVSKAFSTKSSNQAFDVMKEHFDNLLDYRKGQAMTDALDIQDKLGKLATDDGARVINMIETAGGKPITVTDDASALARQIQDNLKNLGDTEQNLGLLKTQLQDYFPHQLKDVKVADNLSTWQKIKNFFYNADGVMVDAEDAAKASFGDAKVYSTKLDAALKRNYEGTIADIKKNFGIDFQDNPAIAYAQRAMGSAKAVTSKEFFDSAKQFGIESADDTVKVGKELWVSPKAKDLAGFKFSPDVARQIDQYYEKVKPEELSKALKTFDSVQNWWKAQALTAPSYHVRNFVGNMWNNFLAGVVDPAAYHDAGAIQMGKSVEFTDDAGRLWNNTRLLEAAKQTGVINEGWYAKDIETALSSEVGGISWNPIKQNFALFRANRAVGSALENNARLAHFIDQLRGGATVDNAAASVKKFLFDYGDLTTFEKQVMKRAVPFYTWTRKNIPLQIEQAILQPGKFAAVPILQHDIEANVKKPNEKYLSDYIKNNVGVRVGTDSKGNTLYFLMGNWLPAAQAIDFLSQPTDNFIQSVSPFFKTPIELWANQSSYFADTFGDPQPIERYPAEQQSWLGLTMRKKTAYVLKNIRILNELDKLNPGSIFGDKNSPSLWNRIAPDAGVSLPGVGTVTTSEKRFGGVTPPTTMSDRILESMFGKTAVYNPNYAKQFYLWDTQTKVEELTKAIKNAQVEGQKEYAKRLREELQTIQKERSSSN